MQATGGNYEAADDAVKYVLKKISYTGIFHAEVDFWLIRSWNKQVQEVKIAICNFLFFATCFCMLEGEREKRKDELLVLQKSKQDRTDAELTHLRLVSFWSKAIDNTP